MSDIVHAMTTIISSVSQKKILTGGAPKISTYLHDIQLLDKTIEEVPKSKKKLMDGEGNKSE